MGREETIGYWILAFVGAMSFVFALRSERMSTFMFYTLVFSAIVATYVVFK